VTKLEGPGAEDGEGLVERGARAHRVERRDESGLTDARLESAHGLRGDRELGAADA
jgi:hypothetical protein